MSFHHLTVVAEMIAKPGKEQELLAALMACVEPTRKESGCIQYDLHESTDRPGHFLFYENWVSPEALAEHLRTPHLTRLQGLIPELLEREPRISTFRRIA
jgi:quinol monooxygenase YgiN